MEFRKKPGVSVIIYDIDGTKLNTIAEYDSADMSDITLCKLGTGGVIIKFNTGFPDGTIKTASITIDGPTLKSALNYFENPEYESKSRK